MSLHMVYQESCDSLAYSTIYNICQSGLLSMN